MHRNILTKYYSIQDDWYRYWYTPSELETSSYKQSMVSTIDFPAAIDGMFATSGTDNTIYVSFEGYLNFTSSGSGRSEYTICLHGNDESRSKMYLDDERIIDSYSHPNDCVEASIVGLKTVKVMFLEFPSLPAYLPYPSLELTWQTENTSEPRHFDAAKWLKVSNNLNYFGKSYSNSYSIHLLSFRLKKYIRI